MENINTWDNYSRKSTIIQIAVSVAANTGLFLSGMVLGFPSAVLGPLVESQGPGFHASVEDGSWISSVAAIASPVGCLLGGPLVDKFGRRKGLQLLNIPNIVGWLLLTLVPSPFQSVDLLILGRLLTGFAAGLATCASTTYIAEVVIPPLRTILVTLSPVMMGLGIFVVYLLADLFQDQWTFAAGVGVAVTIVSFILTPFLPESPLWLLERKAPERARNALMVMRGTTGPEAVEDEFSCMTKNVASKNNKISWKNTFANMSKPEAYKPLIIMNFYFLFQQISGVSIVIVYG